MACSSGNESHALVFCTIKHREVFSAEKFHCFVRKVWVPNGGLAAPVRNGIWQIQSTDTD